MENPKRKRGRKKRNERPALDFLESPVENYSTVEHPDFGQPIEFATTIIDGQTQWISPHIKTTFVTPKQKRSAMARVPRCNMVVLKQNQEDDTTIIDKQQNDVSKRVTRSMSKSICTTPNFEDNMRGDIDEVDSPIVPSNLSTPDMRLSTSLPSSIHYLFQAETPTSKDFIVLAKNTPL